jgi:hypothetical protein
MRIIKINSITQCVIEFEIENNTDHLKQFQEQVGGYIEAAYEFKNKDTVFVNEEGLLNNPQVFFEIKGANQPFAGHGIVVGFNPKNGESISAKSSLAEIKAKISFLTLQQVQKKYG